MSSYTSNLNLLKKDPTTDGNDTFDIKTMLNDNWDKIDNNVAKHKKNIVYIEESQNWTVPSGVYEIAVFLIGGGSGGYGARYDEGGCSGKGGYGAYPNFGIVEVTPGTVIPIIIGAGGTCGEGRPSGNSGGMYIPDGGGTSSFGNLLFAAGAKANQGAAKGGASNAFSTSEETSKDGLAGGNNDSLNGTASRSSYCDITNEFYGGGGGSGCWLKYSTQTAAGGAGGGGGGTGGSSESLNGQDGSNYGGGGGGGGFCSSPRTYGNGGNGHAGGCIIAY